MKTFQRILIILLCLMLLLPACGAPGTAGPGAEDGIHAAASGMPSESTAPDGVSAGSVVATGKYIEENITPPLSAGQALSAAIGFWPDGTLYCITYSEETAELYTTADCGATWQQRTALRFAEIHPGGSLDTRRFAAAPDGNVYYACRLKDTDDTGAHLYRAAPDGTCAEISVDMLQEHNRLNEAMWLYALRVSGDGKLLLDATAFPTGQEGYDSGTRKLSVIDPETGRCEREISTLGSVVSTYGQNGFYELGYDGQLMYYDYAGGAGRALGLLDTGDDPEGRRSSIITVLDEEALTFAALSHDDLRIVTPGGALTEILCTGSYTFSDPRVSIKKLIAMPDGSFVVWYTSDAKNWLCRYVFDGDAPIVQAAGTLTVWALNDSDTLRGAIAEFRALHPEADVVLELGHTAGGDGLQDSDIITALNTRLIAGNAPDVLILDGLPARGYIQKGALLDLSGLVDESDYFANILNAWKTDGGVWAYPAFAKLCVLVTEPALELEPASLSGLAEATVRGPAMQQGYDPLPLEQQPLMATSRAKDLLDTLYPAVSAQIFPDGAALNEEALREYYAAVAAIAQKHGLVDEDWEYQFEFSGMLSDLNTKIFSERSRAAAAILDGVDTLVSEIARRDAVVRPMPGNAYVSVLNAAVPAKAAQPDLAKAFIRDVLLGSAIQSEPGSVGLPISRSGLAAAQEEYVAGMRARIAKQPGEDYGISEPYLEKALTWDYAPLMEQAQLRAEQSVLLHDIVEENMRAILRGELSVDEAVAETAAGVRLYFAEQG